MNFNAFALKMTMTAALVAGMTVVGSMPAQAAIMTGQKIAFTGDAKLLDETAMNTILDFLPNDAGGSKGRARAGVTSNIAPRTEFDIQDIKLKQTSATSWIFDGYVDANVTNWFTLGGVQYSLTAFNLTKVTGTNDFLASIQGLFDAGLPTQKGSFSSQEDLSLDGTTFSAQLRAGDATIPTPALLPGLIGLGASIVRKKRQATIAA